MLGCMAMMRILIRDNAMRYLIDYWEWSYDDQHAITFPSTEDAEQYCQRNFLQDVQFVLHFGSRAPDVILHFRTVMPA